MTQINLNKIRMKMNHVSLWNGKSFDTYLISKTTKSDQLPLSVPNNECFCVRYALDGPWACCLKLEPCHPWTSSSGFKCFWGGRGGVRGHAGGLHEPLKSWKIKEHTDTHESQWAKGAAPLSPHSFWFCLSPSDFYQSWRIAGGAV